MWEMNLARNGHVGTWWKCYDRATIQSMDVLEGFISEPASSRDDKMPQPTYASAHTIRLYYWECFDRSRVEQDLQNFHLSHVFMIPSQRPGCSVYSFS